MIVEAEEETNKNCCAYQSPSRRPYIGHECKMFQYIRPRVSNIDSQWLANSGGIQPFTD